MKSVELLDKLFAVEEYTELVNYMKDSIRISGDFLAEKLLDPVLAENNLLKLFVSYVWRFMFYLQEIAASNDTLNVLGVNSIGRSAIEAYAIAFYVFKHREEDAKVFEKVLYTDLKQIDKIINKYDCYIASHEEKCLDQEKERDINRNNFNFIVYNYFSNFKEVSSSGVIDRKKTLDNIINSLLTIDKKDCEFGKGGMNITCIIEKALISNQSCKKLFKHDLDYTVQYAILCSSIHSNYSDVWTKIISSNNCFAPNLYPNENDKLNKINIINVLYCCMIDALKCITEF